MRRDPTEQTNLIMTERGVECSDVSIGSGPTVYIDSDISKILNKAAGKAHCLQTPDPNSCLDKYHLSLVERLKVTHSPTHSHTHSLTHSPTH